MDLVIIMLCVKCREPTWPPDVLSGLYYCLDYLRFPLGLAFNFKLVLSHWPETQVQMKVKGFYLPIGPWLLLGERLGPHCQANSGGQTLTKLPSVDGVFFGGYPLGSLVPSGGSTSAAGDVWVQGETTEPHQGWYWGGHLQPGRGLAALWLLLGFHLNYWSLLSGHWCSCAAALTVLRVGMKLCCFGWAILCRIDKEGSCWLD